MDGRQRMTSTCNNYDGTKLKLPDVNFDTLLFLNEVAIINNYFGTTTEALFYHLKMPFDCSYLASQHNTADCNQEGF